MLKNSANTQQMPMAQAWLPRSRYTVRGGDQGCPWLQVQLHHQRFSVPHAHFRRTDTVAVWRSALMATFPASHLVELTPPPTTFSLSFLILYKRFQSPRTTGALLV
jgi:hypothetical protein